jgi:hypothetical protein
LYKFNSSLSDQDLNSIKALHEGTCPKQPSKKNKKSKEKSYIIDEAQYERLKNPGWKQTSVPHERNEDGGKENVSERSWRQIRETIFPSTIGNVVASAENRPKNEMFLMQFGNLHVPTQQEMNPNSLSLPTGDDTSHLSTILSAVTGPQTYPSTVAFSDPGAGSKDIYNFGLADLADQDPVYHPPPDIPEHESSSSLTGTGEWDNLDMFNIDPEFNIESNSWLESFDQSDLGKGA